MNRPDSISTSQESLTEKYLEASSLARAVEPNRRLVALLIDLIVCYLMSIFIGILISLVPILPTLLPQSLIASLLFMTRDYFFNGRGVGKNIMGLQVVDAFSSSPASLAQSIKRNIVLTAPLLVLELAAMLPGALTPPLFAKMLKILETLYAIIFLPLESYRAFSREDSLRIGDELACTRIIPAETSFAQFVPKKRN